MSKVVEDINSGDTLPSDWIHKLNHAKRAASTLVGDLKSVIDKKYDALIKTSQGKGDVPPAVEFARVATAPVITLRQQTHRCQEISVFF